MRLIDADAVVERLQRRSDMFHFDKRYVEAIRDAIGEVLTAPALDAVPVVRCEECVCCTMWNDQLICSRIRDVMDGYYHGTAEVVNPDDYCSRGKRRMAKPHNTKIGR